MRRSALCRGMVVIFFAGLVSAAAWAREKHTLSEADLDIKRLDFDDLQSRLRTIPPGTERDYLTGILANADNQLTESIQLLTSALPALRESRPDQAVVALRALADDYNKLFRYGEAESASEDLLDHFSGEMSSGELKDLKHDLPLAKILSRAPPQTISWGGLVQLKAERNPLNSQNVELTVNGVQGAWLLDTGANLSVVSQSFAQRLRLDLLPGVAQVQAGLTGIENPLRAALIPTLQLGGATLHNVVVLVLPDANLNISMGKDAYQINGIIGYPVLEALGTITFFQDGKFEAGGTLHSSAGSRMFMRNLTPIVECTVQGKNLPLAFDTGAAGTALLARYFREFHGHSKDWKKKTEETSGAGGVMKRKVYFQPALSLGIGGRTVTLRNVPVFKATAASDLDELYGNLGRDVTENFESFTLDFRNMVFSLGEPAATQ